MEIKKITLALCILGMATTAGLARAAVAADRSAEEIGACMRVNLFDRGAVRDFGIKSVDREGRSKALKFKAFWKPAKETENIRITLQVIEPDNLKGTAYLRVWQEGQEKLYLYLPALRRVRQVAGGEMSQKLWGSDLAFADIKQIQGLLLDGEVQRLADQQVADRSVYLLETATDATQTGYRKVRSYVDQQSCMLLKAELFTDSEEPLKVLEADVSTMMEIDPWWVILGYRMTDNQSGTHTEIQLSDIYIEERLPGSLFTPEGFYLDRK